MGNELKVGQTFRVFEILYDIYSAGFTGRWTAERADGFNANRYGFNSFLACNGVDGLHFNIFPNNRAKQVGLLRITKLK